MNPLTDLNSGPTPPSGRAATTVVVIDDDPEVLHATARILAEAGYQVLTGGSAAEALALTGDYRPAMLLLDVVLPDGDGLEVARQLKADPELVGVFVVLLSCFRVLPEEQAAGLASGLADGYIVRPFNKPEFLARIDALLRLRDAQEALREALREKEALLREVHHRVKNNLQLVGGLLRLRANQNCGAETRIAMEEMRARISAVVLLHETLYQTADYARVNLADYLRKVVTYLFRSHTADAGTVRLVLELAPVEVITHQAIPCGLLVNELVTNCLKHALPTDGRGEVRIGLWRDEEGRLHLRVADNGVGLAPDFDMRNHSLMGLKLVVDLARQLGGSLESKAGPGTSFEVVFLERLDKMGQESA